MSNKKPYMTVFVRTTMQEVMEKKITKVQVGTKEVEKKKGLFSKETQLVTEPTFEEHIELIPTGKISDTNIGIEQFAADVDRACNELHEDGYDVISVIPVLDGRYKTDKGLAHLANSGSGYGWGYGYSITGGVTIIGKLRA